MRLPAALPLLRRLLPLLGLLVFCGGALANDGQLILVAGEVTLQRALPGQPVQTIVPTNGTVVVAGDALVTGADGRVQIRFSDGSLLSLQPRSEFRIDDYRFDLGAQRGFFSLVRGALRTISGAIGKRDPDDYRMSTPTASIGIRGTEFVVEETVCDPSCHPGRTPGLRVAVSAGHVVVYNAAGAMEVTAGNATYVAGPSSVPVPTSERPTLSTAPTRIDPNGTRLASAGAAGGNAAADGTARRESAAGVPSASSASSDRRSARTPASRRPDTARPAYRVAAASPTAAPADAADRARTMPSGLTPAATDFNRPTALPKVAARTGDDGDATDGEDGDADGGAPDDPIAKDALSPSGDGTITAPVNGAPGGNEQRGPDGTPVVIAAIPGCTGLACPPGPGGGLDAGDGNGHGGAGSGNPGGGTQAGGGNEGGGGTETGGGGDPGGGDPGGGDPGGGGPGGGDPGGGDPGGGDPGGGDPGGGDPPVLTPGLNKADRITVRTLQSPWFDLNLTAANSHVNLDSQYRLESIGLCPSLLCIARGTAQVVDAGHTDDLTWGRWVNGNARITVLGLQSNRALGANDGVHYLVGVPTVTMPTSGSAYYTVAGATSPTFASGAVAPGSFTGQGLVQFGSGEATRIGFRGDITFRSGEHYQMFSNGTRTDTSGRLVEIGATQIRMTGRTTFSGALGVVSVGGADRLGCGAAGCQANLEGGFYGPAAASMGIGYSLGKPQGGDTINGVAVLNRR